MNDNVKKIFEMLGVKPNEKFKVMSKRNVESEVIHINTSLRVLTDTNIVAEALRCLLTGEWQIVKLPKKKKLRDFTMDDLKKWTNANCKDHPCNGCLFRDVNCNAYGARVWVNHKDLYSDKFLDQEVEVPEE